VNQHPLRNRCPSTQTTHKWVLVVSYAGVLSSSSLSCGVEDPLDELPIVERSGVPADASDPVAEPGDFEAYCGPGYCIGGSFCDDCACYSEDSPISQAACVQGLIDPSCGIGECVAGGYCDGPNCPESGVCWTPDTEVSQIMCSGDTFGDCGPGYCIGGSFCDDCVCYSEDSPISQTACSLGLIDPGCGIGECIDGSYCDGQHCPDTGVCWAPDTDVSQIMCQENVYAGGNEDVTDVTAPACLVGYRAIIVRYPKPPYPITKVTCVWEGGHT